MRLFLFSLMLAIFAYLILPSSFYTGDMAVHTMFIKKLLYADLFHKDYTVNFTLTQKDASIYYPVVSLILKYSPLSFFHSLRLLYFLFLWLLFAGILLLVYTLTKSVSAGLFWSLLILLKFHVGGSAIETLETEFVPRGLGLMMLIWSLVATIKRRYVFATVLVAISTLLHVLTGFYGIFFYLLFIILKKWRVESLIKVFGVGLLIIFLSISVFDLKIDEKWLSILRIRNSYAFLDLWSIRNWTILLFILSPGFFYLWYKRHSQDKIYHLLKITYLGSTILSLTNIFFAVIYPIHEVILLQLGRTWIFPVYASLLSATTLLQHQLQSVRMRIFILGSLIVYVVWFNLSRAPASMSEWRDISRWANGTNRTCIFLTPFYLYGFRSDSERAIVGDYKDGTLSFYSRDFALDWWGRYIALRDWESLPEEAIVSLRQKYRFNYVVSKRKLTGVSPVHQNSQYFVYPIASSEDCQM